MAARFLRKTLQIATGGDPRYRPVYIEFTEHDIGAFAYNINYIWFSERSDGGIGGNNVNSPVPFDWTVMEIVNGTLTFKGWIRPETQNSNVTLYLFATNDPTITIYYNYYARWYGGSYITASTWNYHYTAVYHLNDGKDAITTQDRISAFGNPTFVEDDGVFGQKGCFAFNDDSYIYDGQVSYTRGCGRNFFFKPDASMSTGLEYAILTVPEFYSVSLIPQGASFYKVRVRSATSGGSFTTSNGVFLSPSTWHHIATATDSNGAIFVYLNGVSLGFWLLTSGTYQNAQMSFRLGGSDSIAYVSNGNDWINGAYTDRNTIVNGQASYNFGSYYIWYDNDYPGGACWVISNWPDSIGSPHWHSPSTNIDGTYIPVNTTGNPVVSLVSHKFIGYICEARSANNNWYYNDGNSYENIARVEYYNASHYTPALGPAENLTYTFSDTMSGGVKVISNAYIKGNVYDQTMSGGAKVAGQASGVYEYSMAGGVVGAGHASEIHPTIIPVGGVVGQGSAPNLASIPTYGGAIVSSDEITPDLTYNVQVSNGSQIGGSALVTTFETRQTSGGVSVIGSSLNSHGYTTEGGIVADGESIYKVTYRITTSGGVKGCGDSWVDPYIMLTEALMGGSALVQAKYAVGATTVGIMLAASAGVSTDLVSEGGVALEGTAGHYVRRNVIPTAGVKIASEAGEQALIGPYWDTMQDGASLSGAAYIDPEVMNGGVQAQGNADITLVHQPVVDLDYATQGLRETVFLTGSEVVPPEFHSQSGWSAYWLNPITKVFSWRVTYTFDGKADFIRICGPAAEGANSDTVQIFAGTIAGGTTSPCVGSTTLTDTQITQLLAGQLYWLTDSSTGDSLRAQLMPRQGVHLTGSAVTGRIYSETMDGGVQTSGNAQTTHREKEIASGGASINGLANNEGRFVQRVSGGSKAGGSASYYILRNTQISGGVKINSSTDVQATYTVVTSGGIANNGAGIIGIAMAMSGGVSVCGEHAQVYLIWPRCDGGASISPSHSQTFFDWYDAVGSIKVGGKSLPTLLQVWQTHHFNYGRCMASENILTTVDETPTLIPPTNDVSPELSEGRYRIQHEPGWCEVEEKCEQGVLPEVIQRRQGQYLPPKIERVTRRDRGFATADAL